LAIKISNVGGGEMLHAPDTSWPIECEFTICRAKFTVRGVDFLLGTFAPPVILPSHCWHFEQNPGRQDVARKGDSCEQCGHTWHNG
jgi:hypothetical protein